jgi:Domain of unknown function (DUF5666)
MQIPTWRLALTGAAISILAVTGIGLVAATGTPPSAGDTVAAAVATAAPDGKPAASGTPGAAGTRGGLGHQRLLRAGRRIVHAEMTVIGRDGQLVYLQVDHGTVTAVGGGSLTISEAGGGSETVSTDDATVVHVGRAAGSLGDVKVGAEVFVQSRVDGGKPLAKRIVVIPAGAGS